MNSLRQYIHNINYIIVNNLYALNPQTNAIQFARMCCSVVDIDIDPQKEICHLQCQNLWGPTLILKDKCIFFFPIVGGLQYVVEWEDLGWKKLFIKIYLKFRIF